MNGSHFCTFQPKIDLCSVNSLEIDGDVRLTNVKVVYNSSEYPELSIKEQDNLPECVSPMNCGTSVEENTMVIILFGF